MRVPTDENDDDDSDSDVDFSNIDMSGVDFDVIAPCVAHDMCMGVATVTNDTLRSAGMSVWQQIEHGLLFNDSKLLDDACASAEVTAETVHWTNMVRNGHYVAVLRQMNFPPPQHERTLVHNLFDYCRERETIPDEITEEERLLQLQIAGIAAFNLFLQVNYTGPSLEQTARMSGDEKEEDDDYDDILRPSKILSTEDTPAVNDYDDDSARQFHNRVLAELAVDGEWPCQVCQLPYWLLVGRTLLQFATGSASLQHDPQLASWNQPTQKSRTNTSTTGMQFPACHVWSVRSAVVHARLFMGDEPSATLWKEIKVGFRQILTHYCSTCGDISPTLTPSWTPNELNQDQEQQQQAASLILEWGLAQHFMERPGKGRISLYQALNYSGLQVELTGALGKRTKYQQVATAQLQVKASNQFSASSNELARDDKQRSKGSSIAMKHAEDGLLLEQVKYEEEEPKALALLSILDQAILLSLCLDVKNTNPGNDVLTSEEMGAYLSRVLNFEQAAKDQNSSDWMVYATALLERAWLEFESSHSKERSILQLQALADQHSNRLSLTQSSFASVQEQSAPPQDRLRHLHKLVYPPRWFMIRDLAERYAKLGIVTSAAELFLEIELWDQVVECYKRAGKERLAKDIVEQRLKLDPTPRMLAALGDLTREPQHYHKAIEMSNGRFSAAYVSLGQYHFDQGSLAESAGYYRKALTLRPLAPQVWFRLGAISMQLRDWATALEAFSNVVQQEPEEYDAWANVAAIHMRNKCPEEAYPALRESLKYSRTNWRIWTSQLYTCIDLSKYDEAIQACTTLLDLQQTQSQVPNLEEKCIKAIVGKTLALDRKDDSTKRTLSRLHTLLDRMSSKAAAEAWIWETLAYFHEQVGWDEHVLDNLLKEYRALQAVPAWERDDHQVTKVVSVVCQISHFYVAEYKRQASAGNGTNKDALIKCRYQVKGVLQKIKAVHCMDESKMPHQELERLEAILVQVQDLMQTHGNASGGDS